MEENVLETAELSQLVGPVACVKGGTAEHLSRQRFEKTYTARQNTSDGKTYPKGRNVLENKGNNSILSHDVGGEA